MEQLASSVGRPTNIIALPLAPSPQDANDEVRDQFPTEGGKSKVQTDSLASALAEVYRGNSPLPSATLSPGAYSVNLDPGPLRLAQDGEDEGGLGAWAGAGALTVAQMLEQLEDSPQEVDLLAENLPLDATGVEQAVEQYLDQADGLSGILSDILTSERLRPWLHGAALVAVSTVVAHRMKRKAKSDVLHHNHGAGKDEPASPWPLDLHPEET